MHSPLTFLPAGARILPAMLALMMLLSSAASAQLSPEYLSTPDQLITEIHQKESQRMDSLANAFHEIVVRTMTESHHAEMMALRTAWREVMTEKRILDTMSIDYRGTWTQEAVQAWTSKRDERRKRVIDSAMMLVAGVRRLMALHPELRDRFEREYGETVIRTTRENLAILRAIDTSRRERPQHAMSDLVRMMIMDMEKAERSPWRIALRTNQMERIYFPAVILFGSPMITDKRDAEMMMKIERTLNDSPEREYGRAILAEKIEKWSAEHWRVKLSGYAARIAALLSERDRHSIDSLRGRLAVTHDPDGELGKEAVAILSRYRNELEPIRYELTAEINRSSTLFIEQAAAAIGLHRDELTEEALYAAYEQITMMEALPMMGNSPVLSAEAYTEILEPALLLSPLDEVSELPTRLLPLPTTYYYVTIDSIRQVSPAGAVTIAYHTRMEEWGTTIRLYDAKGAPKGTYDQGALPAGPHQATIDVAALPEGNYLCMISSGDPSQKKGASAIFRVKR